MDAEHQEVFRIRDAVTAWLAKHKERCHEGEACAEPFNMLAFLAHCCLVRTEDMALLKERMLWYEANCEGCSHFRN